MKDVNATIIVDLDGDEEKVWRNIKYCRRKYVNQAKKAGLYYEKISSEEDLRKMYEMNMQTLIEGGSVGWTYEKWKNFVEIGKDKFFFIKRGEEIVGGFALSEITEKFYGKNSEKRGIRPIVFTTKKEYNQFRPNDFMYWSTIEYALKNNFSFVDLGGWQINAREHLKNVNYFKEDWGGKKIYYYLDYPFFTSIRRKLIRNSWCFWKINETIKKFFGKISFSVHDEIVKNAAVRSLTSSSSM